MSKQRIFSGIQPSGNLHLGNYLGAIKNWVKLQNEFESIFCVVDLHAITVPQDPEELRKSTIEIAKTYLAAGIDPEKSTIFVQSQIPQHTELMWVLNTIAKTGELFKMTQFKDKAGLSMDLEKLERELKIDIKSRTTEESREDLLKQGLETHQVLARLFYEKFKGYKNQLGSIGAGLMNYPILMAADILLYDAEMVPVGEDQVQHVELARILGKRFNQKFGETFKIPKVHVNEEGMRIMGLDDPKNKMSKSAESKYNRIELMDGESEIREKIKKAVTDSEQTIEYKDERLALKNLINIFSLVTDKKPEEIEADYKDKGYKEFKEGLAASVVNFLKPFQKRYNQISDDEVVETLKAGAKKILPVAQEKMIEVRKIVGFLE